MNSSFERSGGVGGPAPAEGARDWEATRAHWESTRVQTRFAPRAPVAAAGDASEGHDIGRAVGEHLRELFVSCEPSEALAQQLDHLRPEYVAVHDLGTSASRKLLAGIAAASHRQVGQLAIRRPGGGTTLATIDFVDCPASHGQSVRLYSTAVDADTATRQTLARVLLGRSLVGLVIVGDLPGHAITTALAPLREAASQVGWVCRRMVFMPLAGTATLPAEVARFRASTAIDATPSPQVTRPAEVWNALCAAWNQLHNARPALPGQSKVAPLLRALPGAEAAAAATARPAPVAPAPAPLPMPVVGAARPVLDGPLECYLHDLSQLAGVISACAFDIATGQPVGHAGASPGADDLARHGATLLAAMQTASRAMGLGSSVPDASITLGQHHLLLRPLPSHPGQALHVVLDKPQVSLSLVMLQLRRLDDALMLAAIGRR